MIESLAQLIIYGIVISFTSAVIAWLTGRRDWGLFTALVLVIILSMEGYYVTPY